MVNGPELVHFSIVFRIIRKCVERIIVIIAFLDRHRSRRVSTCVWMRLWNCVWMWIWNSRRTNIWMSLWLRIGIVIADEVESGGGDLEAFRIMHAASCRSSGFAMPQCARAPLSGSVSVLFDCLLNQMVRVDTERISAAMINVMIRRNQVAWFMV